MLVQPLAGKPNFPQAAVVDLVQHLHQPIIRPGIEEITLLVLDGGELAEHDAAFLVPVAIAPDHIQQVGDLVEQNAGVVGGYCQLGGGLVAVVGLVAVEGAGSDKDADRATAALFCPELFAGPGHVVGQGLIHGSSVGDALAEAAAADDLLFGIGLDGEVGTGVASQLLNGSLHHHAIAGPHGLGVTAHQVGHGLNALLIEPGA